MIFNTPQQEQQRAAMRAHHPWIKCSLEFRAGWDALFGELATTIESIAHKNKIDPRDLRMSQAKEQWGELTVYVSSGSPSVDEALSQACEDAAERSRFLCEICGEAGQRVTSAAVMTVCPVHTPTGARPLNTTHTTH